MVCISKIVGKTVSPQLYKTVLKNSVPKINRDLEIISALQHRFAKSLMKLFVVEINLRDKQLHWYHLLFHVCETKILWNEYSGTKIFHLILTQMILNYCNILIQIKHFYHLKTFLLIYTTFHDCTIWNWIVTIAVSRCLVSILKSVIRQNFFILKMLLSNVSWMDHKIKYIPYCDVVYVPFVSQDIKRRLQYIQNSCGRFIFTIRKFDIILHQYTLSLMFKLIQFCYIAISRRPKLFIFIFSTSLFQKSLTYRSVIVILKIF